MTQLSLVRSALVALLFVLVLTTQPAVAWNSLKTDRRGVCQWQTFATQCQVPPGCQTHGSMDVSSAEVGKDAPQASPVKFTADALKKAKKLSKSNFARMTPFVQPVDRQTGRPIASLMPSTISSLLRLQVNGGKVLVAMCVDNAPLFVAISSKRPKVQKDIVDDDDDDDDEEEYDVQDAEADALRDDPVPRNMVYEVMEIHFYNGMLHEWPTADTYPSTTSLDIEIHLREAKVSSTNDDGTLVYQSICTSHIMSRQGPDFIISMPMVQSATQEYSVNLLTLILSNLTKMSTQLSKGNSHEIDLGMTMPLISTQNGDVSMEFPFIHYVGSLAQPPCTPQVPRLQLLKAISVPSNALTALRRISDNVPNANAGLRYPLLPKSALHQGKLVIWDATANADNGLQATATRRLRRRRGKLHKKHDSSSIDFTVNEVKLYRDAIPVLVTINIILLSYLLLLLFARLEWIDWPTALGGLNHRVQFYSRAYEELDALKAAGLCVAAAPAPDTQSNDAEENEEEEDGGGGNNEGNEAGRAAARAEV